jgi:ice-binding like protein
MKRNYLMALAGMGFAGFLVSPSTASAQVSLGVADDFAVLGGSAVTATDSVVTGNVGVNLGGAVTQTTSKISGTVHLGDTVAQQAHQDFLAAYAALGLVQCDVDLTGQPLAGQSLMPGVYCFDTAVTETGGQLTLDGPSDGVWMFKIGILGTGALTGTNFTVVMPGGEKCDPDGFGLPGKCPLRYRPHRDPWELGRASPGEGGSDVDWHRRLRRSPGTLT